MTSSENVSSHRSAWEDGLDVIDSLLQRGSPTDAAMSDEQRRGLKKLRLMLLTGVHSVENHIPMSLLLADNGGNHSGTHQFLLSNFAGYTSPDDPSARLKQIIAAHRAARKIKTMALQQQSASKRHVLDSDRGTHLPAQWSELDRTAQLRLRDLLAWENLARWDFDVFEVDRVLQGGNTLVFVAWAILASPHAQYAMDLALFESSRSNIPEDGNDDGGGTEPTLVADRPGYRFTDQFGIKEDTLVEFLYAIEQRYRTDTSYHNKIHAADVTQSLHAILQLGGALYAPNEHEIELLALLLAAVIHDVGHPGENNLFQVHSRSDLALLYNDVSVLENMHVATAFQLIMGRNRDERVDILAPLTDEQIDVVRGIVVKSVLATDMTKHFAKKNYIKGLLVQGAEVGAGPPTTLAGDATTREQILGFFLHLADISNPTKPIGMGEQWADRVLEEFFLQGDKEASMALPISPLCCRRTTRRAQSQIGFINYIVLPVYELLGELIPRVSTEVLPHIKDNLAFWQEQKLVEDAAKENDE